MLEIFGLDEITYLNIDLNNVSPLMSPRPQSGRKLCELDMSESDNDSRKD